MARWRRWASMAGDLRCGMASTVATHTAARSTEKQLNWRLSATISGTPPSFKIWRGTCTGTHLAGSDLGLEPKWLRMMMMMMMFFVSSVYTTLLKQESKCLSLALKLSRLLATFAART